MSDEDIKKRVREIFELINFDTKRLKNKISGFSRGMKQKLGIAAALLHSPDLIMFDEPTSALDPIGRKETINIINSLKQKYTVIFSTHILSDVERICDKIALIEKGTLILEGSVKEIKERNAYLNETLHIEILNNLNNLENLLSDLKKLSFISDITCETVENINIKIKTSDKPKAGECIPKVIAEYNGALCKFEFESANLEDIFISATENATERSTIYEF